MEENLEPTVEASEIVMSTYLVVEQRGEVIAEYPIVDGRMTIGRTRDNHIRIDDPSISRLHAQILTVDNHSLLEDMGSRNGTYYQTRLIKRRSMKTGQRFRMGNYLVYLEQRRGDNEVAGLMGTWERGIAPNTTMEIPIPVF